MKTNWPFFIVLSFGLFMAFILTLVVKTYSVNTELVTEDYYQQELAYQGKLDRMQQLKNDTLSFDYKFEQDALVLAFPESVHTGTVYFYRPSDASRDLRIPLQLNNKHQQSFRKELFAHGLYTLKVDWQSNGKTYYQEQDVYIP